MARIGLIGRIMLILMAALAAVIAAALAVGHVERERAREARDLHAPLVPYPRIAQAAGVIDLVRRIDPALWPAVLRAVNGLHLRAAIVSGPLPETDALRRAPRIEAALRAYAAGDAGSLMGGLMRDPAGGEAGKDAGGDVRAYVDPDVPRPPNSRMEGVPARVVWPTPDGHFLVIDEPEPPRPAAPRLLGLAPGIWIGILGVAVAGLTLFGAQREMRPLRRLTAEAEAFDGTAPAGPLTDITPASGAPDVRRLARAVRAMQDRVAGLLQERSFLIGAISHDLKTYLTRLRLRAEGLTDAGQRERMAADIEGMIDLIETALAFARGTTVSQTRGRVDLADLAAIEAAERAALGQPVALVGEDMDWGGNPGGAGDGTAVADAVVPGDAVALRRVLANLVDNAAKFGRGAVEIRVEAEGGLCRVSVEDDGPGVDAAQAAAIFSPFYRIEGSRSRRTGGSGLGLAIARQIAEAHGGTLAVSRGRLGGARFTLDLPRAAPA